MEADAVDIQRIDVGDDISVWVPGAPTAGADPGPAADAGPVGPTWRVRPAALALGGALAFAALVRVGTTPAGILAAAVLAVLGVLAVIDLDSRILPNRIVLPAIAGVLAWQLAFFTDSFVEVDVPCDAKMAKLAAQQEPLAPGQESIVPTGALRFVDELATTFRRGYALLIDYGSARGPSGEVHGYREHRVLEDVLHDPGSADITAGVDFGAIVRRAERGGLRSLGLASQRDALLALGFAEWNAVQLDRQGSLLAQGKGGLATRVWEGRGRASLLVDPGGLGRQKWLLLATERLPAPGWLASGPDSFDG